MPPDRTQCRLSALEILSVYLYFGKEEAAKIMAAKDDPEEIYFIALYWLKALAEYIESSGHPDVILQSMGKLILRNGDD